MTDFDELLDELGNDALSRFIAALIKLLGPPPSVGVGEPRPINPEIVVAALTIGPLLDPWRPRFDGHGLSFTNRDIAALNPQPLPPAPADRFSQLTALADQVIARIALAIELAA
jgi:hypothetical protein